MKKFWVIMLAVAMIVIMLTGCASGEEKMGVSETESNEVMSESVSEEISEIISEEKSENVSEESIEEVADYSAESVIAKVDEIIATCPYDDPEQIKAAVIGVNLEYILDEDLTILMDTYGYTLEELKDLFGAYVDQYLHHMWLTYCWNIGAGEIMDTMNEEQDLLKYRANIADMYIGQEDAKITLNYIVKTLCENDIDKTAAYVLPEEYSNTEECPYDYQSNELTSNEKSVINYLLLNNEIWKLAGEETILQKLSYTLPYDVKLNA